MIGKLAAVGKVTGAAKVVVKAVKKINLESVTMVSDGIKAADEAVEKITSKKKRKYAQAAEKLKELKELRDLEILTEEEFLDKKQKYLDML